MKRWLWVPALLTLGCGGAKTITGSFGEKSLALSFNLVQGTSTANYSTTAGSITVKVGTANQTIANAIVLRPSSASKTPPVAVLLAGSRVAMPNSGSAVLVDGVSVPIDSGGLLQQSVLVNPKTVAGEFRIESGAATLGRLHLNSGITSVVKMGPNISNATATMRVPGTDLDTTRTYTLQATSSGTASATFGVAGTFSDGSALFSGGTQVSTNPIGILITLLALGADDVVDGENVTFTITAN